MIVVIYFIIAIALLGIDQLTKYLFFGKSFSLIGDFLWIEGRSLNIGAAGGMLAGQMWLFISLAIIVSVIICYLLISKKISSSNFFNIALSLMLAGIIGNFIDRIIFGGVRDFIYFKFINFYIFNFADIYLTFGAIFMCIYILFLHKDASLKKKNIETEKKEKDE